MQPISEAAKYTLRFINQTQKSVFLTGKAGTGKTTLLREIIETTHKNTVVVAPTGIAALNAGGVTIHSMFQLPFGGFIPDNSAPQFSESFKFETKATLRRHFRMSGQKKAVIQNMELLVIDEVSMLRSDLLDAIDFMMQTVRRKPEPFGGVQVLFIGDLLQLPPVIRDDEWRILKNYYRGKFFFHAYVVQQNPPLYIELDKIFRQSDETFIAVLNNLRNNRIDKADLAVLNQYVNPNFDLKANKGYITLTTHNAKADQINVQSLADLDKKQWSFKATITGDFPDKNYPLEQDLKLKVGAQIMFIKNDLSFEKNYFNGKMGLVKSLSENEIMIHFPDENKTIEVEKYEWNNIKYLVNAGTKEIEEEVLGTFVHYPIKLAYAITVHKSQGLTFDKAALDVSQVFMPGQAYVALSRLRSLDGLVLLSPMQMNGISSDQDVMDYAENKADNLLLKKSLELETKHFIHQYLKNTFDWNQLAQEWRNHQFAYNSEKNKQSVWASENAAIIWQLLDPASKFMSQLDKLFYSGDVDLQHISDRLSAAYNYFLKPMDSLVDNLLWRMQEVQRQKNAKTLFADLSNLEDLQVKAVQRLMRSQLLIKTVLEGVTINKEALFSEDIKHYKNRKFDATVAKFKEQNLSLVEEEEVRYTVQKKSKKEPKKSTFLETLELLNQNKTAKEIAEARKLTVGTIQSHFTKLIEIKAISIGVVMDSSKIDTLTKAFSNYTDESLNSMKERLKDDFSWEELKMFKASIIDK